MALTGEPNAAAVRSMWTTVREKVSERSKSVNAMLSDATVLAVEGDTLVLSHPAVTLVKRLGEERNADVIREALKDALGVHWRIRCEAGGASAPPTPQQPAPDEAVEQAQRQEEERMLAEAGSDNAEAPRRDPEEAAL